PGAIATRLYDGARSAVADIVDRPAGVGPAAREQRIGFAVVRLADAMQTTVEQARLRIAEHHDTDRETAGGDPAPGPVPEQVPPPAGRDRFGGLALHTRQAVQVGVATSLAIVVGELISPARWYWAVIAAFVVFAGTASRGDVLSRGWARAVGTAGGVVAGMLLALLVGGNVVASLALLFVCVFLALYLVRISQAMMAFWITAVLALLYGVIGQFSVQTLVLRVEETVVGGALGMLAAYLVLPTRSRTAFAEALDDALTAVDVSLRTSVDAALGRPGAGDPLEKARAVDTAVATVRTRAVPLQHPVARRPLRRGVHHTVRVVGAVDHYTRQLAAQ
ncbi:FUSC family protein, partial [Pseudonocardia sp. SID8383]